MVFQPWADRRERNRISGVGTTKTMELLTTILLVVLILLLIGALPAWPYSRGWGYRPSGLLGLLLVILLILVLLKVL